MRINSQKHKNIFTKLFFGQFLSLGWLRKHIWYIVTIVLVVFVMMANKHKCQSNIEEKRNLEIELKNARTDYIVAKANYSKQIRQSRMNILVDSFKIDLVNPENPPMLIKIYGNE